MMKTPSYPCILGPRLRTLEWRRRPLRTRRVLFLPVVLIVVRGGTILRGNVGKMPFWTGVLGRGELVRPTGEFEGCMVSEVMGCTTEFELQTLDRGFVGGVAKIAGRVERFFDTEGIVLHEMPPLGFFGQTPAYPHRNDLSTVIELKRKPDDEIKWKRGLLPDEESV